MSPDIQELKKLAEAATAGNLDTVPNPPTEYGGKDEEGYVVCPQCDGEGAVGAVTYTNFDGVAMGVQFFGIGVAFQRYEAYFRAASPSTILALIEVAEAAKELHAACEEDFTNHLTEGPNGFCADEEGVGTNGDGKDQAVTFGMIRRLRTALEGVKP